MCKKVLNENHSQEHQKISSHEALIVLSAQEPKHKKREKNVYLPVEWGTAFPHSRNACVIKSHLKENCRSYHCECVCNVGQLLHIRPTKEGGQH